MALRTYSHARAFRLAYTNLQEIWSLVLPPNSLLGLKRLSVTDAAAFRMPDSLWARIVFDFLLAYRLRTINRGHLLGALIPLYLAWVASHINITASGTTRNAISRPSPPLSRPTSPISSRAGDGPTGSTHETMLQPGCQRRLLHIRIAGAEQKHCPFRHAAREISFKE
jgi:hypothetical protein